MPSFDFSFLIVKRLYGSCFYFRETSVGPVFMTVCFSILASGLHLDATNTSENVLRRSSIDVIIFNCGPFIWILLLF